MTIGALHIVDVLLLGLLFVFVPIWVARDYQSFVERVRAGGERVRISEYRKTIVLQWSIAAAIALWWLLSRRSFVPSIPSPSRQLGGFVVTSVALAFLAMQWRSIKGLSVQQREPFRKQLASAADMLPRTDREHATFRALALTAGICEEIVYRGYALWCLSPLLGPWPAVVVGATAFGAAHAYQGAMGIIKTGVVGLLAGALYVWGGTLLWPIILHAALDLQGGAVARLIYEDKGPQPALTPIQP